jgi:hypothetical protein
MPEGKEDQLLLRDAYLLIERHHRQITAALSSVGK